MITIIITIIIILWLVTGFIAGLHLIIKASKSYGTILFIDILASIFIFGTGPIFPLIWYVKDKRKMGVIPKKVVRLNRGKT